MPKRQRGLFITFEGIDGSGKTTQIRKLARRLRREGRSVLVTREPGGTPIADRIRQILLSRSSTGMEATAEVLLYFASRAENVEKIIRPALGQGKIVISDRFTDASTAYQGHGRKLGAGIVRRLHKFVCGDLQPDVTLVLEIDPEASIKRARRRNTTDRRDESRLEHETRDFYQRVIRGYRRLARTESRRVKIIDGDANPKSVHESIVAVLAPLLRPSRSRRAGGKAHGKARRKTR